jgi:UDP-N-acetylglucosamine transferase subunit ALG13
VIFVSVGSMFPFDRLIEGVDVWAAKNPSVSVVAQIGNGTYEPKYASWSRMLAQGEYQEKLSACDLFVAHVGMGSILQALEARKPMILLPRLALLREVTTDHQLHTSDRFRARDGIEIVDDVPALQAAIDLAQTSPHRAPADGISSFAPDAVIQAVATFLNTGRQPGDLA